MSESRGSGPAVRVERIDDFRWRVPRQGGMRTEGLIFADASLMAELEGNDAVRQVANVASRSPSEVS
jgi:tRNA-splicing ligase RtcB